MNLQCPISLKVLNGSSINTNGRDDGKIPEIQTLKCSRGRDIREGVNREGRGLCGVGGYVLNEC